MIPFIALASDSEAFDPEIHNRRDLDVLGLEISQAEGELCFARLEIRNPRTPLSGLLDRRLYLSTDDGLLFSGRVSYVPRGSVSATVSIEATAREDDIDSQLDALVESLKVAPFYDALFVPAGAEDDPSEVLAGYSRVLAFSRTGGGVAAVEALGGADLLEVMPLEGSLSYDVEPVAAEYGVELSVSWRQLIRQTFSDSAWTYGLTTMTPEELAANWPKTGAALADGFTVSDGSCVEDLDAFGDPKRETLERLQPVGSDELDPAWLEAGDIPFRADVVPMDADLAVSYRGEVNRTESAAFAFPIGIQQGAALDGIETETIALRDIAASDAPAWKPNTDYLQDDEVVHGGQLFRARLDHKSGDTRADADWILIGDASYLENRRAGSFFANDRGGEAIAHAVERIRARARIAARCVRVSFEAKMPDPLSVTPDCRVSLTSPRIPGGTIAGRLINYALTWEDGRQSFSGTLAAVPGTGAADDAALVIDSSGAPSTGARVRVSIANDGKDQAAAFDAGTDIPSTEISIECTPAAASELSHEVSATVSGSIGLPEQATV